MSAVWVSVFGVISVDSSDDSVETASVGVVAVSGDTLISV